MWQMADAHFCIFFGPIFGMFLEWIKILENHTKKRCRSFMKKKILHSGDHAGSLLLTWKIST